MDQRNPYNNPHFRNEVQQPDAPEPQNRVQNAVDLLTDPRIPRMRNHFRGYTNLFFSPRGSDMRSTEESTRSTEENFLRMLWGPEVLGPFPPGVSTLTPPNPNHKP